MKYLKLSSSIFYWQVEIEVVTPCSWVCHCVCVSLPSTGLRGCKHGSFGTEWNPTRITCFNRRLIPAVHCSTCQIALLLHIVFWLDAVLSVCVVKLFFFFFFFVLGHETLCKLQFTYNMFFWNLIYIQDPIFKNKWRPTKKKSEGKYK